jgi:hypothetical protein
MADAGHGSALPLARLIVEALEAGTGKQEDGVIDEIFESFGLSFQAIVGQYGSRPARPAQLRDAAAERLAAAASTPEALVNAFVRCGGRFIAMLDEVYVRLSRHAATAAGSGAETFRLARAGIDEEGITISPAFLKDVRRLVQKVRTVRIGRIDTEALRSFVGWDGGECYGRWPVGDEDGFHLPDAILNLAWIAPLVSERASVDPEWTPVVAAADAARSAAERVVDNAETLVQAHLNAIRRAQARIEAAERIEWTGRTDDRFMPMGAPTPDDTDGPVTVIGAVVAPELVAGVQEPSEIGLDRNLRPILAAAPGRWRGGGIDVLGAFIAMWRRGFWPLRRRTELEPRAFADAATSTAWLNRVGALCDAAAVWLAKDVFTVTGDADITTSFTAIVQFLNLPLWKQRQLLYEVWILCTTLDASERAGWAAELAGLAHSDGVWVLAVGPSDKPAGRLSLIAAPPIRLDVWREPTRLTPDGVLTPDVVVSTPGPTSRDLLVIEAKDRELMPSGVSLWRAPAQWLPGSRPARVKHRSGLAVARRYAHGLRPLATWVCNHCDFRGTADPAFNHGDDWQRIHLAAQFRPGNVPTAFFASVRAALRPPSMDSPDPVPSPRPLRRLTIVVDATGSMTDYVERAFALINAADTSSFAQFRAILYSDHGSNDPFLVRKLGPSNSVPDLAGTVVGLLGKGGGDIDEALEDAMQRCRELIDDLGPHDILILTDAPPHPVPKCPYRIDFNAEMRLILASGSTVHVASDWLRRNDRTWATFATADAVHVAPLTQLLTRLTAT